MQNVYMVECSHIKSSINENLKKRKRAPKLHTETVSAINPYRYFRWSQNIPNGLWYTAWSSQVTE